MQKEIFDSFILIIKQARILIPPPPCLAVVFLLRRPFCVNKDSKFQRRLSDVLTAWSGG